MNKNFIRYKAYDNISGFVIVMIWGGLTSVIITSKSLLGIETMNILELVMFVAGIIGVKIGFKNSFKYKHIILFDIVVESIFVITTIYFLLQLDMKMVGLCVYGIMFITHIYNPTKREASRYIEDQKLIDLRYKIILKNIREKGSYLELLGGAIGAILSLVLINILKIDIINYSVFLLGLNLVNNLYDYYKWYKYLKGS